MLFLTAVCVGGLTNINILEKWAVGGALRDPIFNSGKHHNRDVFLPPF